MEKRIKRYSGCHDEIELVYDKAKKNENIAAILSDRCPGTALIPFAALPGCEEYKKSFCGQTNGPLICRINGPGHVLTFYLLG